MKQAMEWCLTDVKSPYDGKVASVFVYICHTQEGTVCKLLYVCVMEE
jgi:hypothetical protein